MALPEDDVARVRGWIDARNAALPEGAVGQIRYEMDVDPLSVTIFECRPPWRKDFGPEWTRSPVARLRYTKARNEWTIYRPGTDLAFHVYDLAQPSGDLEVLLAEIEADPAAVFWG
jgi:hypothetical protein